MMGGSSGAASVNRALRESLDDLLPCFDVAHICGKGNLDASLTGKAGYVQKEYVSEELPDLFAATDIMLSRAGANALSEILALKKPALLVPYPKGASRGDQILNAESFQARGFSHVLPQEQMTRQTLVEGLNRLYAERNDCLRAMDAEPLHDGTKKVIEIIEKTAR